jgi:hypothetical protein
VDDSAEVPHDAALNAFPLTVAFWVKTTSTNVVASGLVGKYADGSGNGWALFISAGRMHGWYFKSWSEYVFPTGSGLDGGFIADDVWHHIVFTVDSSGGRFYVDAVERASAPWVGTPGPCTSTRTVQFGRYNAYPVALKGTLDDVSIWSRSLSSYEVIDLMDLGPTGTEPSLLGLWHLDETTGNAAADSSGNGRTATLFNGPVWTPSDAPVFTAP